MGTARTVVFGSRGESAEFAEMGELILRYPDSGANAT